MYDFQVVIDAGHGGSDPGAVGNGVQEKDLNLMIAQYMYQQFQNQGVPVTLIRSTDETISPTERVRRILAAYGNNPNVIVLSNHINAAGAGYPNAEGAEVIYALRNNDTLARNVLQALENAGQVVRDVYQRTLPSNPNQDYYFIHRNTGVTQPLIIEYGFINNPNDIARIQNNYQRYVDAIVDAVIQTETGNIVSPTPGEDNYYIVKAGDSLWSIANQYNTTVDDLRRINNLTSDVLYVGQVLEIPNSFSPEGSTTYIVKAGDSLWSIANRYNTTVNNLKTLNNLASDNLMVGQILQVPSTDLSSNNYIVRAGDSLWSIASRYNTSVEAIRNLNNLTSDVLYVGQILQIPEGTGMANTYVVQRGDSLWKIANEYGTTVDNLKRINNLTSDSLTIGQILKLS